MEADAQPPSRGPLGLAAPGCLAASPPHAVGGQAKGRTGGLLAPTPPPLSAAASPARIGTAGPRQGTQHMASPFSRGARERSHWLGVLRHKRQELAQAIRQLQVRWRACLPQAVHPARPGPPFSHPTPFEPT